MTSPGGKQTSAFGAISLNPIQRQKIKYLIVILLALVSPLSVRAMEFVEPSSEQKRHCETVTDERARKLCLQAYSVKSLIFPDGAQESGSSADFSGMAIFKPKGIGPFPALLLLHTCGAINAQQTEYWAIRALEEGYVVFVVDSWKQRGLANGTCFNVPPGFAPLPVRMRDTYEALAHLGKFNFVDKLRVAAIGFSHGGRVAHLLASKEMAEQYSSNKQRFVATVAVYGQCFNREFGHIFLRSDSNIPLLSLLGELDEDGDPKECLPRLQALKDKGAPVEWHVFPDTGHAWDQSIFSSPRHIRQVGSSGAGTFFTYDAKIANESRDRAFAFLARYLKKK